MPETNPNIFYIHIYKHICINWFSIHNNSGCRDCDYPHVTDEETKTWKMAQDPRVGDSRNKT